MIRRATLLVAQLTLAVGLGLLIQPWYLALGFILLAMIMEHIAGELGVLRGIEFMYTASPEQRREIDSLYAAQMEQHHEQE
jgi:hypothetical protein